MSEYLPIIGLEVHVELKTLSKMFCGCSADYFGHEPNTHCCPVCLGLPGALPVPNKKAVDWCIKIGLALNCNVPEISKFDRKNYFYPDLPKGYQISQYDEPLCINGELRIKSSEIDKNIRIRRVHMEEDTGKLIHSEEGTLVDFNRSGVPLAEIVSEPDLHSAGQAKVYLQKLQQIIRYLDVSDADMEKGTMRLEPNISLLKVGSKDKLPDYKVEVKNINSFKFVEKAINFEIERQKQLLENGEKVLQETRGWSEEKNATFPRRSKEEAKDYRYFPEPDIPPIRWTKDQIASFRDQIPELPDEKSLRFIKDYGLGEYDATLLTTSLQTADFFEKCIRSNKGNKLTPKQIANWLINRKIDINNIQPQELIDKILQNTNVSNITDENLIKTIVKILELNPKAVADYQAGKEASLMFLVGQVMRETKGQADAQKIKDILIKEILK